MEPDQYITAGEFIDSGDAEVGKFARNASSGVGDDVSRAVKLYYVVRDEILYDPYYGGEERRYFRASDCLRAKRGFCIPKAALLAAAARSVGIPARENGVLSCVSHQNAHNLISALLPARPRR